MARRNASNYRKHARSRKYDARAEPSRAELEARQLASQIRDQLVHERITRQLQEEESDLEQRQEDQA